MSIFRRVTNPFIMVPLFAFAGVLCGALFVVVVGDYGGLWKRQSVILSACSELRFTGVHLGNSVSMNGVDTRLLGEASGETFYNFSSVGQTLLEALCIVSKLPAECRVVVLGIPPTFFGSEQDIPDTVCTKYFYSGLQPNASLLKMAEQIKATSFTHYFHQTWLQRMLHSRWMYRFFLDTSLRRFLRKDLDLERSETDIYHPSPYTKHLSEEKKRMLLDRTKRSILPFSDIPNSDLIASLDHFMKVTKQEGRQGVLVIMPLHPELCSALGQDKIRAVIDTLQSRFPDMPILDIHDRLSASRFVDALHPDRQGTEIVSRELASFLQKIHRPDNLHP